MLQQRNALASILSMESYICTSFNLSQCSNEPIPITFREDGKEIDSRDEQILNASFSITRNPSEKDTFAKSSQLKNVHVLIISIGGMLMLFRDVHH